MWAALLAACQENKILISLGAEGRLHDPNNPDDGFMLDLQAALAVRESAVTRRRIRLGVRSRAEAGKPHGKLAYGYKIVYDPETGKPLERVLHDEQAPIVRDIVRRLLGGEALDSIAQDLDRRGVPPPRPPKKQSDGWRSGRWQEAQVKRIAISPTIAGIRTHHGQEVGEGAWPAIISEADHRTLVAKLTHPARKTFRDGSVKPLLVNIAVCGARIPAEEADAIRRRSQWPVQFSGVEPDENGLVECGAPCKLIKNRSTMSYTCAAGFHVSRSQRYVDLLVKTLIVGTPPGVEPVLVGRLAQPDAVDLLASPETDATAVAAAERARTLRARLAAFYDAVADGAEETVSRSAWLRWPGSRPGCYRRSPRPNGRRSQLGFRRWSVR